jgi:hypothetical protein
MRRLKMNTSRSRAVLAVLFLVLLLAGCKDMLNSGGPKGGGDGDAPALLLSPPENISAKSLADGRISLTWDRAGTETGYVIYRSESQTGTYTSIGRTDAASYTDAAVVVGNVYYYRISAVKNNTESRKSNTAVSALAAISSLASPQGLRVVEQTGNSVSLEWQTVSGAASYKVYKGSSSNAVNEYVAATVAASYIVTGLAADTGYYFAVTAVNENSESLPSAAVQGKTSETAASDREYAVYSDADFTQAVAGINASPAGGIYRINLFNNILNYIVADNFSFSTTSAEKTIIIKGDTSLRTIDFVNTADLFTVNRGNTLVLENNVELRGIITNTKPGNAVRINGGTLVMKAGSRIEGASGSAVYVYNNGTFEMSGGEITKNGGITHSSSFYGGGVYVSDGTFTMSGGGISGNYASSYSSSSSYAGGGGVYVSGGTFTMSGGEISGNVVRDNAGDGGGGGVYVSGGTFTMSGGEISGNEVYPRSSFVASYGGGVYVSGGTFTMFGGEISGNEVYYAGDGGGVYVSDGTFTMSGGEISGNKVYYNDSGGGGVYVSGGTFTMSGGEISGNEACYGGGVYVDTSGNARFIKNSGGAIYGSDESNSALKNTAVYDSGHAVYISSSPAKIRDTTAGAGVTLDSTKTGPEGGWELATNNEDPLSGD